MFSVYVRSRDARHSFFGLWFEERVPCVLKRCCGFAHILVQPIQSGSCRYSRVVLSCHWSSQKLIHVGLFCFPDRLIPVGTLDSCPFPSTFEFLLGVPSCEEDRLFFMFSLIVLESARSSSSTLPFRGPSYAISESFSSVFSNCVSMCRCLSDCFFVHIVAGLPLKPFNFLLHMSS